MRDCENRNKHSACEVGPMYGRRPRALDDQLSAFSSLTLEGVCEKRERGRRHSGSQVPKKADETCCDAERCPPHRLLPACQIDNAHIWRDVHVSALWGATCPRQESWLSPIRRHDLVRSLLPACLSGQQATRKEGRP